jgi:hypothetical protein
MPRRNRCPRLLGWCPGRIWQFRIWRVSKVRRMNHLGGEAWIWVHYQVYKMMVSRFHEEFGFLVVEYVENFLKAVQVEVLFGTCQIVKSFVFVISQSGVENGGI